MRGGFVSLLCVVCCVLCVVCCVLCVAVVVVVVVVSVLLFWQSLIISPSVNHCCHQEGFTDTCRTREPNSLGKMGYTRLLQNFQKGFGQLFVACGHDVVFVV